MSYLIPVIGFHKGHGLFCDSSFTSPALFKELLVHDTYGCGTVKANRKGLPQNFQLLKPKVPGESIVQQKGDMQVITWRDNKILNILTTIECEQRAKRWQHRAGAISPCNHG